MYGSEEMQFYEIVKFHVVIMQDYIYPIRNFIPQGDKNFTNNLPK